MKRILRKYRRQKRPKAQGSPDLVVFQPRQVRKDKIIQQGASLEGLAVEIQQAILQQMPDFLTLRALISASPSYLKAYRSQYRSIQSAVLLRDIHPDVLCDALAILDARKLPRNYDDYVPNLKAFIEQYKASRDSLDVAPQRLESSTMESLSELHHSVVAVTKDFCDYTLSAHPVTSQSLHQYTSPSPNELRRLHRALYRYELFLLLFEETNLYLEEQRERHRDRDPDREPLALERNSIRSLDSQDKSFLYLTLFKAWEVEEIACIRDYIIHRYNELYEGYKLETHAEIGDRAQDIAPWEASPDLRSESDDKESYLEHYLSLGLSFFHNFVKSSREGKLHLLRENSGIAFFCLSRALEEDGPDWVNPMYDAWTSGTTQEFDRDSNKDGPNAGWTWSTGDKVEIRYYQSHKEGLRKWGYVMWDKERLDRWSIIQESPQDHFTQ